MMTARGGGRFWLFVLCAHTALWKFVVCGDQYKVCSIPCCKVQPSCSDALSVDCNCTDQGLTSLRRGDIPESVQSLSISQTSPMAIESEAIYELTSLVEFGLYGMDTLEVHAYGFKLDKHSKMFTFTVENVRHLELTGYAFSGYWNNQARIRIQATNTTVILSGAFKFSSAYAGPSLSLKHLNHLQISSGGIDSDLSYLTLSQSSLKICQTGGFGSSIRLIEMKNVTIDEAQEGCIRSLGTLKNLSIREGKINRIHSRAFSGHISGVSLEGTNVTTVEEKGLQLTVDRFELTSSIFNELKSESFFIQARTQININNVKVNLLRRNALLGLQIQHEKPDVKSLVIRNLLISRADNGSLAFGDKVKLTFYNLSVLFPHFCPVENWTQQLVGIGEKDKGVNTLTQAHRQILSQLQAKIYCRSSTPSRPQSTTDSPGIPDTETGSNHDRSNAAGAPDDDDNDDKKRGDGEHSESADTEDDDDNDKDKTDETNNTHLYIITISLLLAIVLILAAFILIRNGSLRNCDQMPLFGQCQRENRNKQSPRERRQLLGQEPESRAPAAAEHHGPSNNEEERRGQADNEEEADAGPQAVHPQRGGQPEYESIPMPDSSKKLPRRRTGKPVR